jgi:AGCS family alanine or glycine:cation symporter
MLAEHLQAAADAIWSYPVVGLCLFGALVFSLQLGFVQFRAFPHAIALLTGRFDREDEKTGTLTHFQALMAALSGTIGIGNIGGVAIAIATGGPGAVLWMWVLGLLAMATKFVECTLATHYREADPITGMTRGGPMHYIAEGLGPRFKPLAIFYAGTVAIAGFGFACMFQSNQAASALDSGLSVPPWITGIALVVLGALTIMGGIKRIGITAARLVPAMCGVYLLGAALVCLMNLDRVPAAIALIFEDGFSGRAVLGGSLGAIIMAGVRRAVFSNEAGLGSAGMAHAAVKTDHPVREGIVASLGPFIDTVVVSGATAMVILLGGYYGVAADSTLHVAERAEGGDFHFPAGELEGATGLRIVHRAAAGEAELVLGSLSAEPLGSRTLRAADDDVPELVGCHFAAQGERACTWILSDAERAAAVEGVRLRLESDADAQIQISRVEGVRKVQGIALTATAFDDELPGFGTYFIPIAGFLFAFSTMVTWSFYGETAMAYLLGERAIVVYRVVFVGLAYVGATQDLGIVISFSDAMVGLLVIPNMLALLLLSGRVREWSREYFAALARGDFDQPAGG